MGEDNYQGVVIQKLPTIGEAYSMRTISGGRIGSVKENSLDISRLTANPIRTGGNYKTRILRTDSTDVAIFNAKRILNFKNSTIAQKKVAKDFIEAVNGWSEGLLEQGYDKDQWNNEEDN